MGKVNDLLARTAIRILLQARRLALVRCTVWFDFDSRFRLNHHPIQQDENSIANYFVDYFFS